MLQLIEKKWRKAIISNIPEIKKEKSLEINFETDQHVVLLDPFMQKLRFSFHINPQVINEGSKHQEARLKPRYRDKTKFYQNFD